MTEALHALVTTFFADLGAGRLSETAFTDDAIAWTLTTKAHSPAAHYLRGTRALVSLFPEGLSYTVHSVTAEADRAAAEVTAQGVLKDGQLYANHYVMLFRIEGGKIAALSEYFDPAPVDTLIMPLLIAAMGKAG